MVSLSETKIAESKQLTVGISYLLGLFRDILGNYREIY